MVGAEKSIGVKRGGAINVVRHTVKLICTPENIPLVINVDVSKAEIGDSIHISEVALPENVRPAIDDRDFTMVTIAGRLKKEEDAEAAEAIETEVTAQGDEAAEDAA